MSVTEYVAKFNELGRFVPSYVATDKMRMEWFEYGLNGKPMEAVVGHFYANFQEIY